MLWRAQHLPEQDYLSVTNNYNYIYYSCITPHTLWISSPVVGSRTYYWGHQLWTYVVPTYAMILRMQHLPETKMTDLSRSGDHDRIRYQCRVHRLFFVTMATSWDKKCSPRQLWPLLLCDPLWENRPLAAKDDFAGRRSIFNRIDFCDFFFFWYYESMIFSVSIHIISMPYDVVKAL